MELSSKAKENGERYATLTATRAADSVQRLPGKIYAPSKLAVPKNGPWTEGSFD